MMENSKDKVIEGDKNKSSRFPLASISKIVTSLWAIEKLGPDYRFKTRLHVTKATNSSYNVHIEGSRDPFFGQKSGYFLIAELNRQGINIKDIENLTFDENFLLLWGLEVKPNIGGETVYYKTIEAQAEAVKDQLQKYFATNIEPSKYSALRAVAARNGVKMQESVPSVRIKNIDFVPKAMFKKARDTETYVYKSAPLTATLKKMNNQSNNYIADHLYWNLGGTAEFNNFAQRVLSMTSKDMEFHLGSGNNAAYLSDSPKAIYNEATCEAMIKVIYKLDTLLVSHGLQLSDVMAVAGADPSTVGSFKGVFERSMIAKTGTVNRAKTLAGTVSTKNGDIYFVVLMNTDSAAESGIAQGEIIEKVKDLIKDKGGPERFEYSPSRPLPFDAESALQVETNFVELRG